jgi:hypothetical protein
LSSTLATGGGGVDFGTRFPPELSSLPARRSLGGGDDRPIVRFLGKALVEKIGVRPPGFQSRFH